MRARTRQLSGRSCGRLSRKSIRRRNRFPLTIRRPKHLCLPESWSARTAGILWLPPAKHSAGKMALSSTILLISAPGLPLPDTAFPVAIMVQPATVKFKYATFLVVVLFSVLILILWPTLILKLRWYILPIKKRREIELWLGINFKRRI